MCSPIWKDCTSSLDHLGDQVTHYGQHSQIRLRMIQTGVRQLISIYITCTKGPIQNLSFTDVGRSRKGESNVQRNLLNGCGFRNACVLVFVPDPEITSND
jgi:hypothetical protein